VIAKPGATPTRRDALRAAALGAGALAGAGLLRPVAALAQSSSDEDLRDFLAPTIALEQIAVFAYNAAAGADGVKADEKTTFLHLRGQEQAHANALRQALDSLGFDLPEAPDTATDSGVFDVDGISDDQAKDLSDTLAKVGDLKTVRQFVDYLADLEQREIEGYAGAAPTLDSEDLATTSAEIAANHAQHLVILGPLHNEKPAKTLSTISAAAAAAKGSGS
jgi:rubrerythrin